MKTFIKFAAVGVVNTLVDLGILNLELAAMHFGDGSTGFMAAKSISFMCAVAVSYVLNRRFVFKPGENGSKALERGSFLAVSLIGLAVNATVSSAVFAFANGIIGHGPGSLPAAVIATGSALVGTAAVLVFNFFGYKHFVFRRQAA